MRIPPDMGNPNVMTNPRSSAADFVWRLEEDMRKTFNDARVNLGQAYAHQKDTYDRRAVANHYKVGDLVRHHRPIPPPGIPKKFHHPWSLQANRVLQVLSPNNLIIQDASGIGSPITVHHDHVKPFRGEPPATPEGLEPIRLEAEVPRVAREEVVITSAEDVAPSRRGGYVTGRLFACSNGAVFPAPLASDTEPRQPGVYTVISNPEVDALSGRAAAVSIEDSADLEESPSGR